MYNILAWTWAHLAHWSALRYRHAWAWACPIPPWIALKKKKKRKKDIHIDCLTLSYSSCRVATSPSSPPPLPPFALALCSTYHICFLLFLSHIYFEETSLHVITLILSRHCCVLGKNSGERWGEGLTTTTSSIVYDFISFMHPRYIGWFWSLHELICGHIRKKNGVHCIWPLW